MCATLIIAPIQADERMKLLIGSASNDMKNCCRFMALDYR